MALMVTELLDAFQGAGVSDATARRAAGLLAEYDRRFDQIDSRLDNFEIKVAARFDVLEAGLGARIDGSGARVDSLGAHIVSLGARIDSVKSGQDWLKVLFGLLFSLNVAIFLKLFLH